MDGDEKPDGLLAGSIIGLRLLDQLRDPALKLLELLRPEAHRHAREAHDRIGPGFDQLGSRGVENGEVPGLIGFERQGPRLLRGSVRDLPRAAPAAPLGIATQEAGSFQGAHVIEDRRRLLS